MCVCIKEKQKIQLSIMMGIRITYLIKIVKFTIIVKEREKVYLTLKILLYNTIYQKYIKILGKYLLHPMNIIFVK